MKHWIIGCLCIFSTMTVIHGQTKRSTVKKGFILDGKIANLKASKVVLIYDKEAKNVSDTADVNNGEFRFTGIVDGPTYAWLRSTDSVYFAKLFLENNRMTITQEANAKKPVITGSVTEKDNELISRLNDSSMKQLNQLIKDVEELRKTDSAAARKLNQEGEKALNSNFLLMISHFIEAHPKSYMSVYMLGKLTAYYDLAELKRLYPILDKSVQQTTRGKNLFKTIKSMQLTMVGSPALNFSQKNESGEEIALSSFRGKYVLIDFWASWCGPCRGENPNLVKSYQKYKDNGFEILGVSLDEKADKWKEAITTDRLIWTQVSDLKGWKNEVGIQYGVASVPANYLVDPKGIIIAKNLRGEALEKKLSEIFSN